MRSHMVAPPALILESSQSEGPVETIFALVLGWCKYQLGENPSSEDIELVVEEQLREYDLYHTKYNLPELSDDEYENLEYSLGEYLTETLLVDS